MGYLNIYITDSITDIFHQILEKHYCFIPAPAFSSLLLLRGGLSLCDSVWFLNKIRWNEAFRGSGFLWRFVTGAVLFSWKRTIYSYVYFDCNHRVFHILLLCTDTFSLLFFTWFVVALCLMSEGQSHIHPFVLWVHFKGRGIPILWRMVSWPHYKKMPMMDFPAELACMLFINFVLLFIWYHWITLSYFSFGG